jgi:YVTN family beta-propeller protein
MRYRLIESLIATAALGIFVCATLGSAAQSSTPRNVLLALSKRNHTLAIVDPVTLQVIARVPVGPDPHAVIASSDGKMAYVSISGGGRYHALSVIDLVAQKALPDIDTGALNGPHGLAFVGGRYGSRPKARRRLPATIRRQRRLIGSWGQARTGRT